MLFRSISKLLPKYLARKALHMGSGTLCIIAYNKGYKMLIIVVGIIALVGILSKKVTLPTMKDYALRKEKRKSDLGMANFCFSTVFFTAMEIPLNHISPLYYADPMGAIVGRNIKTWKVPGAGNKSVGGALAVILTAYANLIYCTDCTEADAAITAIFIGLVELYSGEWDNVCISGGLALRYLVFHADDGYLWSKVEFVMS